MTKTVKKGTNRKSAMAKRSRHAQRTPLPPRGKVKTPVERKTTRNEQSERNDELRSASTKAALFAAYATEHDWWSEVEEDKKAGRIVVTCKHVDEDGHKEIITAEWLGSRVPSNGVTYTVLEGRTIILRNVSAARKHIDGSSPVKRDVQPRKARRVRTDDDGNPVEKVDDYKPVGADIVDKWYDIRVTKLVTRKGKKIRKNVALVEGITKAQVESQTALWAKDGCDVVATERSA